MRENSFVNVKQAFCVRWCGLEHIWRAGGLTGLHCLARGRQLTGSSAPHSATPASSAQSYQPTQHLHTKLRKDNFRQRKENLGVANLLGRQYIEVKQRPKSAAFHKHYKIMLSRLNWPAASLRELLSLRLSGAPRQFDKLGGRGGPALQLVN